MYIVSFLNEHGIRVDKKFDSEYKSRVFVSKLKHSRTCRYLSCVRCG